MFESPVFLMRNFSHLPCTNWRNGASVLEKNFFVKMMMVIFCLEERSAAHPSVSEIFPDKFFEVDCHGAPPMCFS